MAKVETVNIKSEGGFTTINRSDFDPKQHELFLKEGEIIVKPLGVEKADPFVIDEKDFDGNSYEKVNATKKNLEIVAEQTPRETLTERLEKKPDTAGTPILNREVGESPKEAVKESPKVGEKHTPQSDLKRNQQNKK